VHYKRLWGHTQITVEFPSVGLQTTHVPLDNTDMIKARLRGYSASESPPPSASSNPYLEYIVIGSSVCGGRRLSLGLPFLKMKWAARGEGPSDRVY